MVFDYSKPLICEDCGCNDVCECYQGIKDLKNLAWECLPDEITEEIFKAIAKFQDCEYYESKNI